MPIPDTAFRHVPNLKGKLVDPDTSFYRVTKETFWDWDKITDDDPSILKTYLLSHEARENTRARAMAGRLGADLWLFAYGSLIWDPAIHIDEIRTAGLSGFHRSFCLAMEVTRGSIKHPCLMLNLDRGGEAEGLAFRVPAANVDRETHILWQREMLFHGYVPRFVAVATPQGAVEALTFTIDWTCKRYTGKISLEAMARVIATGKGVMGSNLEYLQNLVVHLNISGICDDAMVELLGRARALAGAGRAP